MTEQQVQEPVAPENPSTSTPAPEESEPLFVARTQKDLDKKFAEEKREAAATRERKRLEELGVESFDEAKQIIEAQRIIEEESATEADTERKKREKAEAKLQELEPYKAQAERYEAALEEHVTAQMEGLPEYIPPLLEGRDPVDKLTWLRENREKVTTPTTEPQAPRGVPPTPLAHNTTQTEQDAAAKQARLDARRSGRSRI